VKFQPARLDHVREIMAWFPDEESCRQWGGPLMHFPLEETRFCDDIGLGKLDSRVALADDNSVLGFGQYYGKLGRCHLARLAVAPRLQGKGVGSKFISGLMIDGQERLGTEDFSLFVLTGNDAACNCYRRLGFQQTDYPEGDPMIEDCIFMITDRTWR
jgi:ribosomal protein S18 acetylase RimI-like enzyme